MAADLNQAIAVRIIYVAKHNEDEVWGMQGSNNFAHRCVF